VCCLVECVGLRLAVEASAFSSSSSRIIHAKDHASIQINIADVDPLTGRMTEATKMYAICGAIRRMVSQQFVSSGRSVQS
jgi:hypothetical protein